MESGPEKSQFELDRFIETDIRYAIEERHLLLEIAEEIDELEDEE